MQRRLVPLLAAALVLAASAAPLAAQPAEDPAQFVAFVQEFEGKCTARQGVQLLVKSTHATRTVRVWLDRVHMGKGTGDRSRTDLPPGADPEPLGCSRTDSGAQEWRIARAIFVD